MGAAMLRPCLARCKPSGTAEIKVINREQIAEVEKIIRPHIRRTPTLEVAGADFHLDSISLIFKLEFLQHGGSFKTRGAFTNLLTREVPGAGVVAASGGNHGVAVAYAAGKLGVPAKIFVPNVASPEKVERIRRCGADLVVVGERYADALAASEAWTAQSGAMPVHAYDQLETLLGQGTVGLELQQLYPKLDTLLVAVGGGGLIGGIAAWYAGKIKLIGVEPEAAPTLANALHAGPPGGQPRRRNRRRFLRRGCPPGGPAWRAFANVGAASGSTPMSLIFPAYQAAMPPMRPPPPTATSRVSSFGYCCWNSRPTVP